MANLNARRVAAPPHHPLFEVVRADDVEVQQLLVAHPSPRIAAVLPVLFFYVDVINKGHLGAVSAEKRQQLVAQIAIRNKHQVNLPRADQVEQKPWEINRSEKVGQVENIRGKPAKFGQPGVIAGQGGTNGDLIIPGSKLPCQVKVNCIRPANN